MNNFETLKSIVKEVPGVLSDNELALGNANQVQRQTIYTEVELDNMHTQLDSEMHINYDYKEDAPGMRVIDTQTSSSNIHPLFFEEGIDKNSLLAVLTLHNQPKDEPTDEELANFDKPVVAVKEVPHFEKIDSIHNEHDGYTINFFSNGTVAYEELIGDDDFGKSKYQKEMKAFALLRKNLRNRRKDYKLRYSKADDTTDAKLKSMYMKLASKEYAMFQRLSRGLDILKELSKKIWVEKSNIEKTKLLERFVEYQQESIKEGVDPMITWPEVKKKYGFK